MYLLTHLLLCSAAIAARTIAIEKRATLLKRTCFASEITCAQVGLISYCAPAGATCCPGGKTYASSGRYCCSNGDSCPNGKTCAGCAPAEGSGGIPLAPPPAVSPTTTAPIVASPPVMSTTTILPPVIFDYFSYTITYYYFSYYYIYVPTMTRSITTSTRITTTAFVTVYASNSADAEASLSQVLVTAVFPTPAEPTILPKLPPQTLTLSSTQAALTAVTSTSATIRAPSSSPTQFVGGAARVALRCSLPISLCAWFAVLLIG